MEPWELEKALIALIKKGDTSIIEGFASALENEIGNINCAKLAKLIRDLLD